MKTINTFSIIIICILLSACKGGKQNSFSGQADPGDTLKIKYAQNISIVKHDGYTTVTLANPWNKQEVLSTYLLTNAPEEIDESAKQGCIVVKTPLKKALVGTAVHCALLDELGKRDAIAGVCDPNYINLKFITDAVSSKKIADCGSGMQPNVEKVTALSPDAIFLSPYEGSAGFGKIEMLDIPIIQLADYMETSPLGRAEWMIFYSMLFGKEDEATKLFNDIEQKYISYKEEAAGMNDKNKVLIDKMVQATWFLPGGNSTIGQMLKDANCDYIFAETKESGSIEKSFEQVLQKGADADVWLVRYSKDGNNDYNLEALGKENEKYKLFKAYKSGNVFGCETTDSHFFEETPFHPERLLNDLVLLTHKENSANKPKYYKKL